MKKTILTTLLTASLLTTNMFSKTIEANNTIDEIHQVFVTKTNKMNLAGAKKEFVFFGKYDDLKATYADIKKSITEKGLEGAIKGLEGSSNAIAKGFFESAGRGLGAGVGIGIIIGLANPFVMSLYADEQYILIYDFTSPNGDKVRVNALFAASDFDDEEVIKEYLENKINEVK